MVREEELRLVAQAAKGDRDAQAALLLANNRMIWKVALPYLKKYPRSEADDLVQGGRIGLLEATQRFDPAKGCRFLTYAVHWIRRGVQIEGRKAALIHVPVYVNQKSRKQKFKEFADHAERVASLHAASAGCEEPLDFPSKEEPPEWLPEEFDRLQEAMAGVHPTMRRVLMARFHDGETLKVVGVRLGVTKERVRQIEVQALHQLKRRWLQLLEAEHAALAVG